MSRSANRARIASDVVGDGGIGMPNGMASWIVDVVAHAATAQQLVQQQRRLARRRRALERRAAHADDRRAGGSSRSRRARLRAGHRVELVAHLGQARGGGHVVVGAQRDDEDVGFVGVQSR